MMHWYTRYEISNALDRGDLAAVLARGHAARCAACQRFAAQLQAQHARLARSAASAPAPAAVAGRRSRRAAIMLGAPLAVAAAIALTFTQTSSPPADRERELVVAPVPVPSAPAPGPIAARVSALFARASEPLDDELRNLVRDGRRGVNAVLAAGGLRGLDD